MHWKDSDEDYAELSKPGRVWHDLKNLFHEWCKENVKFAVHTMAGIIFWSWVFFLVF